LNGVRREREGRRSEYAGCEKRRACEKLSGLLSTFRRDADAGEGLRFGEKCGGAARGDERIGEAAISARGQVTRGS
jgi:hypothetical protein